MTVVKRYHPFEEAEGKIYFRRARTGPVYEISAAERTTLRVEMKNLRLKMTGVIAFFVAMFLATIFFMPQILQLNFNFALMVVVVMLALGIAPFLVMVKLHLIHQRRVRGILGKRQALSPNANAAIAVKAAPAATQGINSGRLAVIFLLGVAITTVGIVMLFSGEDVPFRKQLIWWMNLVTGALLSGLGLYGLVRKKPSQTILSDDDQNDQP